MKTRTIAGVCGLLAAATLLVADGAQARRLHGDHHGGAANAGNFYDGVRMRWSAAAAAEVDAKAAARAAYDARSEDFFHRCYQPQRIGSETYYRWRLVNVC